MIIRGEAIEKYHEHEALSASKAKILRDRGLYYFKGRFIDKTIPPPATRRPEFIMGQAVEDLYYEGEHLFWQKYAVEPVKPAGLDLRRKKDSAVRDYLAALDEFRDANRHKITLTPDDARTAAFCVESLKQNEDVQALHLTGEAQLTMRINSDKYGIGIQCRPDWFSFRSCELSGGLPYFVDLKTTNDYSSWWNEYDPEDPRNGAPVEKYGYHKQAALAQYIGAQHDEIGRSAHFLVVVEKQGSYRSGVFQLEEDLLSIGWNQIERDIMRVAQATRSGSWPRTTPGVKKLKASPWADQKEYREWDANAA
jgi:hypothetical protein